MRDTKDCFRYKADITRLTKANSTIINGLTIYMVKKSWDGKSSSPLYCAYDYATKILLHFDSDKSELIGFLFDKLTPSVIQKIMETTDEEGNRIAEYKNQQTSLF